MASDELPVSPVRELRDRFGDPKPPDISRKITACAACRKQKVHGKSLSFLLAKGGLLLTRSQIKCHMKDSQPPCERCEKKGLPCSVNRSLQMLLESDVV